MGDEEDESGVMLGMGAHLGNSLGEELCLSHSDDFGLGDSPYLVSFIWLLYLTTGNDISLGTRTTSEKVF